MTKDMTTGSPIKHIILFAIPLMLGTLFQQFYSMADTIIVGQFIGVDALAAVGATGSLNYLILGCAVGICSGFSIPVAQSFGAKNYHEMRKYYANALWLSAAFGLAVTVLSVTFTRDILVWMNTPENIIDLSVVYIRTIFAGVPATLLYNIVSSMMRALGDSKHPLYFLIFASFLNIGLDLLFILGLDWGVFGAAVATVLSQGVAGILSYLYLIHKFPELRCSKEENHISMAHCRRLVYIGVPMGLQCSITAIGAIILQCAINGLGSAAVAAQTAGSKANLVVILPMEQIGTTMATYCSQNLGARRIDRVRKGVLQGLFFAIVYAATMFCVIFACDKILIELFIDQTEVLIIEQACTYLFWCSAFYVPLAFLIIYRYTIQGLGFSGFAMIAGVTEMVSRIAIAQFCTGVNGFFMVCMANPASWSAAAVASLLAYTWLIGHIARTVPQAEVCG